MFPCPSWILNLKFSVRFWWAKMGGLFPKYDTGGPFPKYDMGEDHSQNMSFWALPSSSPYVFSYERPIIQSYYHCRRLDQVALKVKSLLPYLKWWIFSKWTELWTRQPSGCMSIRRFPPELHPPFPSLPSQSLSTHHPSTHLPRPIHTLTLSYVIIWEHEGQVIYPSYKQTVRRQKG